MFSTVRGWNTISTLDGVQYCGGLSTVGGWDTIISLEGYYQYIGWCSVHGMMFRTVEDVQYCRGSNKSCGGIPQVHTVFNTCLKF